MEKVKRSWRLLCASLRLVRTNPSLLVFPVISAAITVAFLCLFLGGWSDWSCSFDKLGAAVHRHKMTYLLSCLGMFLPSSLIFTFCQSAMVGCVLMQMEGKPHDWRDGLRMAWVRRRAVAGWSLIGPIGWLLILPLERTFTRLPILGPYLGKIFLIAMGITWSLVTFLIIPVIVFEEQPNLWARLRRSEELFKRTWGETIVGRGAVILFGEVILCIIIIVPFFVTKHSGWVTPSAMQVLMFGAFCGVVPALSALSWAIQGIYSAACYGYAVTGMLPQEFSAELLPPSRKA